MLACRRNYTGPLLISAKTPPEASGHWPIVPAPQAQISTPALAGVSGSHQTLPLAGCDNGPSLPQFPHLESGCSSTHPTPQCSASRWVVLLTLGVFKQVFAASPCSGFIWMVILSAWAAGPSNPSQIPSPSCCPPGLHAAGASAEHPTKGPDPCATRPGASREGSIGGSGNATLRTLHALGLPSFSLELLSWEGPSQQLPINLAALDHVLGRCWESALERRLGKGEGGPCPESEEESSAPLGLNFSTLFRRSLKTRIVVSRASRLDSRAGAGLEQRRSQQLSLTRILWSSS